MVTLEDLGNVPCASCSPKSRSSSVSSESTSPSRFPRVSISSGTSSSDAGSWESYRSLRESSRAASARQRLLARPHQFDKLPNVPRRGYDRSTEETWSMAFAGTTPRDHKQSSYQENVRRACRDWLRTPRGHAEIVDFTDIVEIHSPARVKPAWWSVPRPPTEKRAKSIRGFDRRRYSSQSATK
jgi:hypothetical protein|mmetsp:Transcript_115656/g.181960  ORF Transcript_115656/g.181960 Transcript_115656/m.181960 type:complete len:184 (+) Transcript_115656:62-613(+)